LLIFITWLLLRIFGAFSVIPIFLTTFIVLTLPFAGVIWLVKKTKNLKTIIKRNWRKSKENLPTVRKWIKIINYIQGILIFVAAGSSSLSLWYNVAGPVLGTVSGISVFAIHWGKKKLKKIETRLVEQQSLIMNTNPAETSSQEAIELGEMNSQEFETRIEIPSSSSSLRLRQASL
jgi:hypothetical protein